MEVRYNIWVYIEPVFFDGEDGTPDDSDIGLPEKIDDCITQKQVLKELDYLGFSKEDIEIKRTEMEAYEKSIKRNNETQTQDT